MILILAILVCFFGLPFGAEAEETFRSKISGVVCSSAADGSDIIPVANASVMLVTGRDTLYTVSDERGRYSLTFDQSFEVELQISHVGYEPHICKYQLDRDFTQIVVELTPLKEVLDAAVVKGEIPLFTSVEDTVIFNAAALDRMEGDRAVELLKQIPGFDVKEGSITVWGEPVQKTYVNGKLIFGDNVYTAVSLLGADEVKSIRVYDQQTALDRRRGLKHSRKERVLDVVTFKSFMQSTDIVAQSRGGADAATDVDGALKLRYAAGADASYNSEMTQMSVQFNGNNVCDDSNKFEVITGTAPVLNVDKNHYNASASLTKKWHDAEWGNSIHASYSYQDDRTSSSSRRVIDRIRSDGNIEGLHYDESESTNTSDRTHCIDLIANFKDSPLKDISLGLGLEIAEDRLHSIENMAQSSDESGLRTQNQIRNVWNRRFDVNPSISWWNNDSDSGWVPGIILGMSIVNDPGNDVTIDTLSSSFCRRYLTGESMKRVNTVSGALSAHKTIVDNPVYTAIFEAMMCVDYLNSSLEKYTFNKLLSSDSSTDNLDISNSCHYSWNDLSMGPYMTFTVNSAFINLFVMTGLALHQQDDREFFPSELSVDKKYIIPGNSAVHARFHIANNSVSLLYSMNGNVPSIEQTRQRMTNNNPLRLQLGNPDLKASYKNQLSLSYKFGPQSSGSSFELSSTLNWQHNAIIDKVSYYSSASSMQIWGQEYLIPAGATLTTYENASGMYSSSSRASYGCRVKPLKGTLNTTLSFVSQRIPQYDGETLNSIRSMCPSMSLSLTCMPISKYLRLVFMNSVSYMRDKNNSLQVLSGGWSDIISASSEIRFLKNAFADVKYSCTMYRFNEGMGADTDIQNLNFALGCRLLKGNLGLSITGNDMLNDASSYRTSSTSSEFIQTWTPSFGRYYMLNIAYRFGKRD